MTEKYKTILNYFILILLAAAIIASGRYINSRKVPSPAEKDYATKLAELRADLTKANTAGSKPQRTSGNKRTTTGKSPKAGST